VFESIFGGNKSSNDVVDLSSTSGSGSTPRQKQERILEVRYNDDPEIQAWRVTGPTAGFGSFDRKKQAMDKARSLLNDDNYSENLVYTGIRVYKKNGRLQKTIGDV